MFPFIESGHFSRRSIHTTFDNMLQNFPMPVMDHDYDLLDALAQGKSGEIWVYPVSMETENRLKAESQAILSSIGKPYNVNYEVRV